MVDIARYLRTISNDFGGIFFTGFVEYFLRVNMIGGIALLEAAADRIIEECKADAPNETGWCKIRDAFVVPAAPEYRYLHFEGCTGEGSR